MDSEDLTGSVAQAGDVIETEPCFELTAEALAYVAEHGAAYG